MSRAEPPVSVLFRGLLSKQQTQLKEAAPSRAASHPVFPPLRHLPAQRVLRVT